MSDRNLFNEIVKGIDSSKKHSNDFWMKTKIDDLEAYLKELLDTKQSIGMEGEVPDSLELLIQEIELEIRRCKSK